MDESIAESLIKLNELVLEREIVTLELLKIKSSNIEGYQKQNKLELKLALIESLIVDIINKLAKANILQTGED
jgi:hypothetical protein